MVLSPILLIGSILFLVIGIVLVYFAVHNRWYSGNWWRKTLFYVAIVLIAVGFLAIAGSIVIAMLS